MNKTQIIAALLAAGVTEANETMTVEALKALAAERGVSLVKPTPPGAAERKPTSKGAAYYDELVKEKVRAGLPLNDAIEVAARQRAEDEGRAGSAPEPVQDETPPEE